MSVYFLRLFVIILHKQRDLRLAPFSPPRHLLLHLQLRGRRREASPRSIDKSKKAAKESSPLPSASSNMQETWSTVVKGARTRKRVPKLIGEDHHGGAGSAPFTRTEEGASAVQTKCIRDGSSSNHAADERPGAGSL
ncbi:hypothetical protein ACJJTC_000674 [Scirpophaga incertulas]